MPTIHTWFILMTCLVVEWQMRTSKKTWLKEVVKDQSLLCLLDSYLPRRHPFHCCVAHLLEKALVKQVLHRPEELHKQKMCHLYIHDWQTPISESKHSDKISAWLLHVQMRLSIWRVIELHKCAFRCWVMLAEWDIYCCMFAILLFCYS